MKMLTITKGVTFEYLYTSTYRFNWFLSQIALTTLKQEYSNLASEIHFPLEFSCNPSPRQSHWVHCEKGPAEVVLPSPAEDVQPATGAAETVLLCHHWIRPLHINNCLFQLSYQIWPQKTTDGSPDCWANNWYTPPHSPWTVLIQSEQKGWKKGPSGRRYRALSTRTARHRNSFFPQAIHEHLTLNVEHTTLWYIIYLFITHTYFSFQICTFTH